MDLHPVLGLSSHSKYYRNDKAGCRTYPDPWNSGPRYERRSFWKSGFITTPSTLGPKALRNVGGCVSVIISSSRLVSRRQSTISSWSLRRSSGIVQFAARASFRAYITGSSTTAHDDSALPERRIALLKRPGDTKTNGRMTFFPVFLSKPHSLDTTPLCVTFPPNGSGRTILFSSNCVHQWLPEKKASSPMFYKNFPSSHHFFPFFESNENKNFRFTQKLGIFMNSWQMVVGYFVCEKFSMSKKGESE